jgi:DNA polymerase
MLDRMFAAIGMARHDPDPGRALYIPNVLPWRPPADRDPAPEEMAMMLPFVKRHVELAAPEFLVFMGNTPCAAILGQRGITRMRGNWTQALGLPVLPMLHPAYLLRRPEAKRDAWADLLTLQARLRSSRAVSTKPVISFPSASPCSRFPTPARPIRTVRAIRWSSG